MYLSYIIRMPLAGLSGKDRAFFALVSRAAFSNPFGQERDDLDRQIAEEEAYGAEVIDRATDRVGRRLEDLEGTAGIALMPYAESDRELIEHAILFHAFHLFVDRMDGLIDAQQACGAKCCKVAFAQELFCLLGRRGFGHAQCHRALELFYQMRRAHRFIGGALVGSAPSMRQVREGLWNNVFTRDVGRYERYLWNRMDDFSTILVGETGTGKTTAASALGRSGFIPYDDATSRFVRSFTDVFVDVNLSEFPESLIESELFGHRKGAFTGAIDTHEGWLSRCREHGTIFLDEIGDIPQSLQLKLLRVLEDRIYSPVGSHEVRRFGGRVVAATHQPLDRLRAEGKFRDDFYYRLCSDVIRLPPFRLQLEEEPSLLGELVFHIAGRVLGQSFPDLVEEIARTIEEAGGRAHPWAGNVRELEQCIRRVLLTGKCELGVASTQDEPLSPFVRKVSLGELDADGLMSGYCTELYQRLGSYADVASVTQLDPRTVKKYVRQGSG